MIGKPHLCGVLLEVLMEPRCSILARLGAPGECFGAHLESESPKWRTRSEQWYSKRDYLVPVMRLWDTLGLHVEAAGGKKRAREAPEVHPAEIVKQ